MGVITMCDHGVKTGSRCDHALITEKQLVVIRKLLTVHAVITVESKGMLTKCNQWEKLLTCDHTHKSVTLIGSHNHLFTLESRFCCIEHTCIKAT